MRLGAVFLLLGLLGAARAGEGADRLQLVHDVEPALAASAPKSTGKAVLAATDLGNIAAFALSGPYDRGLIGPRQEIAQRFYQTHPDEFDFLIAFTTFEFPTGDALAFYQPVRNDVDGIGIERFDHSAQFGSAGRLQGFIDMAALSRYDFNTRDAAFRSPLNTLTHEIQHRWSVRLHYHDAQGVRRDDLIGRDGSHWSLFAGTEASIMYGARWQQTQPGRYAITEARQRLGWWDLYLAGWAAPEEVPELMLVRSADASASELPRVGMTVQGSHDAIALAQAMAAEGVRQPSASSAQRRFDAALLLVARPGEEIHPRDLARLERFRSSYEQYFQSITGGRATLRLHLRTLPGTPIAGPAPLAGSEISPRPQPVNAALAWLREQQHADGRWQDRGSTATRDTAAAVLLLADADPNSAAMGEARQWLETRATRNQDEHAWRQTALPGALVPGAVPLNADGGLGVLEHWSSSPIDSLRALDARRVAYSVDDSELTRLVDFLRSQQNPDGSFSASAAGPGRLGLSALAAERLLLRTTAVEREAGDRARDWLDALVDGQALAADAFSLAEVAEVALRAGALDLPEPKRIALAQYLLSKQGEDGDWGGSVYTTAIAALALQRESRPNLVPVAVVASPAQPVRGEDVRLRLRVANRGGRTAAASTLHWYDGDPDAGGVVLGDAIAVRELLAGDEAVLDHVVSTLSWGGPRELYAVLDRDDAVEETLEDDNTLTLTLDVQAPPAGIDLALDARDLAIDPTRFDRVPSTVTLSGRARNLGLQPAGDVLVRVFDQRGTQATMLGETRIDVPATDDASFQVELPIARAEAHTLRVVLDPEGAVTEARENNNSADILLPFGDSIDLELVADSLVAAPTVVLGEDASVRVTIANRGTRDAAATSVVLEREAAPGDWQGVAEASLLLPAAQQAQRTLVWRPAQLGPQSLRLRVDPADLVAEVDEGNNQLGFAQDVVRNDGPSLAAIPGSVAVVPDPVLQGAALRVSAGVRNLGQSAAPAFDAAVYRGDPRSGGALLGSVRVSEGLDALAERSVQMEIADYAERGDATLFVQFDAANEVSEGNEDDNYGIREITALSLADLSITANSIVLTPVAPVPGSPVQAQVQIANLGEQASPAATVQLFELGGGERREIGGVRTLPAIAAGQTHMLEWDWNFGELEGARAVSVQIDRENLVRESDETNNEAARVLDVQDGDAFVTEPYFSPNGDGVRDQTRAVFAGAASAVEVLVLDHAGRERRRIEAIEASGNGSVSAVWDGRDGRGRVLGDGRYALLARSAAGTVFGPAHATLDIDRPMALEAANSEDGVYRELPVSEERWVETPEGTPGEDYVFTIGRASNPLVAMQRGVLRSHALLGGVEPVITPRWLDRYAQQNDLASLEPAQLLVLHDGRLMVSMHEWGGENRSLLFIQAAGEIDRPELVASFPDRDLYSLPHQIDANRFVIHTSEGYEVRDLRDAVAVPLRSPGWDATVEVFDAFPDGVVFAGGGWSGTDLWMFSPFDPAQPTQEPSFENWGGETHRLHYLRGAGVLLFHRRANSCGSGGERRAKGEPQGPQFDEGENEAVFVYDLRTGEWRKLYGVQTADESESSCSRRAKSLPPAAEEIGDALLLSLRAFWLEHEQEAVVIDHAQRQVMRFDAQGRALGATPLPASRRTGGYAFVGDEQHPADHSVHRGENPESGEPEHGYNHYPALHPVWRLDARSRLGFERRYFDADADALYLSSGEYVFGYGWYSGSDGAIDFLRVERDGTTTRVAGRSATPLLSSTDQQSYPLVDHGNAAQLRAPSDWPRFIHRNGTLLRRDGRVQMPSQGRTSAPWRYAGRLIDASPSQTRLQLRGEDETDEEQEDDRTGALFSTLHRLTAVLGASSDGRAIALSGVATDRNFDHFQIDWAFVSTPDAWNALVPPTREQVRFDDFITWAPPQAGAYLFRLRVADRAGNVRERFASADVAIGAPIANVRQNFRAISPNADGVQDALELRFVVLRPTEQRFSIRNQAGQLVYAQDFSFGSGDLGAGTWTWDGRDQGGTRVPDGRYRAELSSGFGLRVNVDVVAPQLSAALTQPHDHYDLEDIANALKFGQPLVNLGPVIDYRVREVFAGQVATPTYEAVESSSLQGSTWTALQPYQTLGFDDGQKQALLAARQYLGSRFRIAATDAAGNRSELGAGSSERLLLFAHGQRVRQTFPVIQTRPWGRAEDIPDYPYVLANDPDVDLIAYDLAGGLESLSADEKVTAADGSAQWITRATGTPTPQEARSMAFAAGQFSSIPIDLTGRQPGSWLSMRLRGRYPDGGELTTNALRFQVGGLELACNVKYLKFRAISFLEEPASDFRLEMGRLGEAGDILPVGSIGGDYVPLDRIAYYDPDQANAMIGAAGLPAARWMFRVSAVDGQRKRRYSAWDPCRAPLSTVFEGELSIVPAFGPVCAAIPSGRVNAIWHDDAEHARYRLVLSSPLSDVVREVPLVRSSEPVDTTGLPEGTWLATLQRQHPGSDEWEDVDAQEFPVDRQPPQLELESPREGDRICALQDDAPSFAGIARDSRRLGYLLSHRTADSNHDFSFLAGEGHQGTGQTEFRGPAYSTGDILDFHGRSPFEFLHPLDELQRDERVELRALTSDWSGAQVCETVQVDVDAAVRLDERAPARTVGVPGFRWPAIAPTGSAPFDQAEWFLRARERVDLRVAVYAAVETDRSPFAQIEGDEIAELAASHSAIGDIDVSWNGRIAGTPVPDGLYGIRFIAYDDCGNELVIDRFAEVDSTPPAIELERPDEGEELRVVTVSVVGSASDAHFDRYDVAVSQAGANGPWEVIAEEAREAPTARLLAQWPTAGANGPLWIRLQAFDQLRNRSTLIRPLLLQPREEVLRSASIEPWLFSPNADGTHDETEIRLELRRAARLTVRVTHVATGVVRVLADDEAAPPGPLTLLWDGRGQGGAALSDDDYVIGVRAVDATQPDNIDEQPLEARIDTLAPRLDAVLPDDAYVRCDELAKFDVDDLHLRDHVATLSGPDGATLRREGAQIGTQLVAEFEGRTEGPYRLAIEADDLAGNHSETERDTVLDCTAPDAVLTLPYDSVVPRVAGRFVELRGRAQDAHFRRYRLELAPTGLPDAFELLHESTTPVEDGELLRWQPTQPDGEYLLRLRVEDEAGNPAEVVTSIRIDGTPPRAEIESPGDAEVLGGELAVFGYATDENFLDYRVEIATPEQAAQDEWSLLFTQEFEIHGWELARASLALDATLRLRLAVRDRAGLESTHEIGIRLDSIPPPALVLSGTLQEQRDVRLDWVPPQIDDLEQVRVYRDGAEIALVGDGSDGYLDRDVPEGELTYVVIAIDEAGNEGPPSNAVVLQVDRTPPDVALFTPVAGERVRATYVVSGQAVTADDDFREWELALLVGGDEELLRRSPAQVPGGTLHRWDTRAFESETTVVLRLSAVDLVGNRAAVDVPVVVDNEPPAAPTGLVAVDGTQVQVDWDPNTEPDLLGYLLYRGGELVGYGGALPADLRPLALSDNRYADVDAPDGEISYRVYAIDLAGNISEPSAPAELDRDAGPPELEIVRPQPGQEFESPIEILARSPDRDIASVAFSYRAAGGSDWTAIGSPVAELPWRSTFDPEGLDYGDYELRAVAIDEGGRVDPEPPVVPVRYADLTPPAAPTDVSARADGEMVRVRWNPVTDEDLDGYRVERREWDGRWIAVHSALVDGTEYLDPDRVPGAHDYRVLALDESENASEPSASDRAHVFELQLEPLPTPTASTSLALAGRAYERGGALSYRVTSGASQATGSGGDVAALATFALPDVALFEGENTLQVRITDAEGNISIPASRRVRRGLVPSAPQNLQGMLTGNSVDLDWDASASADVVGYRVFRNGRALWLDAPLPQSVFADDGTTTPIDADMQTSWTVVSTPASATLIAPRELTLQWPTAALIAGVRLHFADAPRAAADYRIYASSEYGDWILLATRSERSGSEQRVVFDEPYPTTQLRVAFERAQAPGAEVALAEIELLQRTLESSTSGQDTVSDGHHVYEVSAVSALGFESLRSTPWSVDVGDAEAPPPVVLSGSVAGDTAQLQWTESVAPDLHGYAVLRDGQRIGEVAAAQPRTFSDPGLANGHYVYKVIAEDTHFNASAASNAVALDVAVDGPARPRIDSVAQEGEQALRVRWSMEEGAPAASFRLHVSSARDDAQQPYELLVAIGNTEYLHQGLERERDYWYRVQAVDARGNAGALSEPRSGRVRDTHVPLTPRLTWPTRPGIVVDWYEPRYAVCGRTSPGARVTLAANLDTIAPFDARSSWSSFELDYAQLPMLTLLSPDGDSVFMPGDDFDTRPGWFDLQTGVRAESVSRFTSPLEHVRASRDGRVVVASNEWGELMRFRRDESWVDTPPHFGTRVDDFAIDDEGARLLVLGVHSAPDVGLYLWTGYDGGYEQVHLPSGRSVRAGSLAWQGDHALFADAEGRVYELDARDDTLPVEIGTGIDRAGPFPAPLGRSWLAIQGTPARVTRHDAGLPEPRVLLDDGRVPLALAWSPDAQILALRFVDRIELRDASTGALLEAAPQPVLAPAARVQLQWSAAWRLLVTTDATDVAPQAVDVPGTFCRDGLEADPGSNVIQAIARNASGLASGASEPIEFEYYPQQPEDGIDLELDALLVLFPSAAHLGESRSVSASIRNQSEDRVVLAGRYLSATLTLPDGSTRQVHLEGDLELDQFEQHTVALPLGTMSQLGAYRLRVDLDPEARVAERDENNNSATAQWQVRANDLPYLTLATSRTTYAPGEPIDGETGVFNPGPDFDGEIVLQLLDPDGGEVAQITRRAVDDLGPAQTRRFDWSWDVPDDLLAGEYRVRATLLDALGDSIDERDVPVTLAGEAEFGLVLQPPRSTGVLGQTMPIQIGIDYLGGNRVFAQGTLRLSARASNGDELLVWQGSTGALLPGYHLRRSVSWSAAQQAAGVNTLRLSFAADDVTQGLARDVELLASPAESALRGSLTLDPGPRLVLGAPAGTLGASILNPGSAAIAGAQARVRILEEGDSSSRMERIWPLDLASGATFSQPMLLDDLAPLPRAYAAVLEARLATDPAGEWRSLATLGLQTVDGEGPVLTLVAPDALAPRRAPVPLAVRILDRHSRVLDAHYRVDGGPWRTLGSGGLDGFEALMHQLSDGTHTLDLRARDLWDNESRSNGHPFVVDSTPPQITVDGVEEGALYLTAPSATISIQDAHPDGYDAWLDGRPYVSGSAIGTDGLHRLEVIAIDRAGNRSERAISFSVDRTAPPLTIVSPADGSSTELDAIEVRVQSEDGAQLHLQRGTHERDVVADAQGRASFDAVPLEVGANVIRVTARDAAGNQSGPVSVEVTRTQITGELGATLSPASNQIPRGQDLALDIDLVNASATAFDDLPLRLRALASDNGVLHEETLPVDIGVGASLTLSRTLPSASWPWGPVTLLLEADTGTGLRLLDSAAVEVIDAEAPALQALAPLAGSVSRPPVTLAAHAVDARGVVAVEYRLDDGAWTALPAQPGDEYATQLALDDGAHEVRYRARDAAANEAETGGIAFVVDATAPQIVIDGVAAGETYVSAVTPVVSVVDANPDSLTLTLDGASYTSGTQVTQHGTHRLHAVAEDAAGNRSEREIEFELDLEAPAVSFVQPSPDEIVAAESVLVIGSTEAGATVMLQAGLFEATVVAGTKGVFNVADVPLAVGENQITARATDTAGNTGAVATLRVFRSEDGASGLRGTIAATPMRVPVGNDATLDFGVIETAGVARTALPLRVQVHALAGGAALATRERSVALAAGGSAAASETVSSAGFALGDYVATLSAQHQGLWVELASATYEVIDATAPTLAFAAPASDSVHRESALVAVQAADDSGVVEVQLRVDGGAWQAMTPDGVERWQLPLALPREGALLLEARARDAHDNTSVVISRSIRSDRTPPVIEVSGVSDGQRSRVALTPVVGVTDASAVETTLRLDGASFVSGTPVVADGAYTLSVQARDEVGLESELTLEFEIDSQPPALTFTYPPSGTHVSVVAIDVLGVTEAGAMVELSAPGGTRKLQADASGGFVVAALPLVSGDNVIRARATDAAGNVGAWVSTSVLRACGTSELACPIFGDGFEPMHRDGFEARGSRPTAKSAAPPQPDDPDEPRPRAAALVAASTSRSSLVSNSAQPLVNP